MRSSREFFGRGFPAILTRRSLLIALKDRGRRSERVSSGAETIAWLVYVAQH